MTTSNTFDSAFDGTTYSSKPAMVHGNTAAGLLVTVTEGDVRLSLETIDGTDLYQNAVINLNACKNIDAWTKDRIAYSFSLAAKRLASAALLA